MRQGTIGDGFEHANAQVDGKDRTCGVLKICFAKGPAISEEKCVVFLRENHGVGALEVVSIEVFDDGCYFYAEVRHGLTKNRLMSHIGNERRTLLVKDKSRGLTAGGEGDLHGAFARHLVHISIGAHSEKVALAVLSRAV